MGSFAPTFPFGGLGLHICKFSNAEALSKFIFSGVTMDTSAKEADLTGKELEAVGAIMLAAFLPRCV